MKRSFIVLKLRDETSIRRCLWSSAFHMFQSFRETHASFFHQICNNNSYTERSNQLNNLSSILMKVFFNFEICMFNYTDKKSSTVNWVYSSLAKLAEVPISYTIILIYITKSSLRKKNR